ncbi:MAG: glycogen/starch synthase [Blastocatellia bacterium]|nr:glycogen/starch synthase [Blastocatellia bacterium]
MRIIFVASEANPWVKTGGLADVAAALPKALQRRGHDVALIMPRYDVKPILERAWPAGFGVQVPFDFRDQWSEVYYDESTGIPTFFIDAPQYFMRGKKEPYGDHDDGERFAYFCRAAVETMRILGPAPDIVQCNDWMTALVPAHIKVTYGDDPFWYGTGTLLTIHNLAFQGLFDPRDIPKFGFSPDTYRTDGGFEFNGTASMLKAGLLATDMISTVSRKYAEEIQTPEFGFKMDGLLRARSRDLEGILNGVDYDHWNPEHDEHIAAHFSVDNLEGKRACKMDLLSRFSLPWSLTGPSSEWCLGSRIRRASTSLPQRPRGSSKPERFSSSSGRVRSNTRTCSRRCATRIRTESGRSAVTTTRLRMSSRRARTFSSCRAGSSRAD